MLFLQPKPTGELRADKLKELSKLRRSESLRGWLLAAMIPGLLIAAGVVGALTQDLEMRTPILIGLIAAMMGTVYFGVAFHARAELRTQRARKELKAIERTDREHLD